MTTIVAQNIPNAAMIGQCFLMLFIIHLTLRWRLCGTLIILKKNCWNYFHNVEIFIWIFHPRAVKRIDIDRHLLKAKYSRCAKKGPDLQRSGQVKILSGSQTPLKGKESQLLSCFHDWQSGPLSAEENTLSGRYVWNRIGFTIAFLTLVSYI